MLYVCLRLDRNFCLILYFYYIKFVVEKNNTNFYYIDMYIFKYLKNKYKSAIIQNSISLNDKNKQICTKIMLDFY